MFPDRYRRNSLYTRDTRPWGRWETCSGIPTSLSTHSSHSSIHTSIHTSIHSSIPPRRIRLRPASTRLDSTRLDGSQANRVASHRVVWTGLDAAELGSAQGQDIPYRDSFSLSRSLSLSLSLYLSLPLSLCLSPLSTYNPALRPEGKRDIFRKFR